MLGPVFCASFRRALVKYFSADRVKCFRVFWVFFKAVLDDVQMWQGKEQVLCEKARSAVVNAFFCSESSKIL